MELSYIFLENLKFKFLQTDEHIAFDLTVHRLQMDDQCPQSSFPVALVVRPTAQHPALRLGLRRRRTQGALRHYEYLSFLLQACELRLEARFIVNVLEAVTNGLASAGKGAGSLEDWLVQAEDNVYVTRAGAVRGGVGGVWRVCVRGV